MVKILRCLKAEIMRHESRKEKMEEKKRRGGEVSAFLHPR